MIAFDIQRVVKAESWERRGQNFPFRTSLSLRPLIQYWRERAAEAPTAATRELLARLEALPALSEKSPSLDLLQKHQSLLDDLTAPIFPAAFRESDCTAAVLPFSLFPFIATPPFRDTFMAAGGQFEFEPVQGEDSVERDRTLSAYVSIAARMYGFVIRRPRQRLVYTSPDPKTGLKRYYDFFINTRFIEILTQGQIPTLTESKKQFLQKNLRSMEAWIKTLPVQHFEFSGFSFIRAIDVTMQEVTTSIKQILIDKDSITTEKSFRALEENLCTLLQRAGLELRLTIFLRRNAVRYSCLRGMQSEGLMEDYLSERRAQSLRKLVESLNTENDIFVLTKEEALNLRMELDLRWLNSSVEHEIVAPLRYQGELIGFLELGSRDPIVTNEYQLSVLQDILPLVSVAAKRSLDELQSNVHDIIRDRCTAIHPSIEWRFEKAAFQLVSTHNRSQSMERIEFKGVYPLYSFTDICSSTSLRNSAIRKDLLAELHYLQEVLRIAQQLSPMPMVDLFLYRVEHWRAQLEQELSAGDDLSIESALNAEINPFIQDLRANSRLFSEKVTEIEANHPGRMTVTSARESFEDSLLKLNEVLSLQLDEEEQKAQRLCPHYYEKRVTDGVEHSVYVGAAISEYNLFSRTSLRNLRLWQLLTAITLERKSREVQSALKHPLQTAHCVVVQDTPLDIHFKYDEKRFGVAGLANIRFEIIKKRVEKALVNDRGERLTQGGHLAIVYSQDRERAEYMQFLEYLSHIKLIDPKIEDLELKNTQELRGLRALRARIL